MFLCAKELKTVKKHNYGSGRHKNNQTHVNVATSRFSMSSCVRSMKKLNVMMDIFRDEN